MPIAVPFNSLRDVKKMVKKGRVKIRPNVLMHARRDFGWGIDEIKKALLKLENDQCYKAEPHNNVPTSVVDYYRAESLLDGESVYTHLYVKSGWVVVNSFKEL